MCRTVWLRNAAGATSEMRCHDLLAILAPAGPVRRRICSGLRRSCWGMRYFAVLPGDHRKPEMVFLFALVARGGRRNEVALSINFASISHGRSIRSNSVGVQVSESARNSSGSRCKRKRVPSSRVEAQRWAGQWVPAFQPFRASWQRAIRRFTPFPQPPLKFRTAGFPRFGCVTWRGK